MSEDLQIGISKEDGDKAVTVLRLKGSLDANTQSALEDKAKEAIDAGTDYLILDMSGVDYLGSAGMRAIHAITNVLSPDTPGMHSDKLKVLNPSPAAMKVFKTLGFDSFIDIHANVDEAIASF
ncbi:MAG: STAS domain-containing protein [Gammaproteobacteria bacterium]|nr:STAS domain-containing protein [Gammaproteobacteria bacterium]